MSVAVLSTDSDRDLVADLRRGDSAALGALYQSTADDLLRLATRLLGSRADAEDLVHDLFVALPELLATYEHRDRLPAWLRGIAIRGALNRLRRDKRRRMIVDASLPARASVSVGDPWTAVDLERAIAALAPPERSVFVLRQFEDLPHGEIAALLGISSGAVRVRYTRALDRLRSLLESGR